MTVLAVSSLAREQLKAYTTYTKYKDSLESLLPNGKISATTSLLPTNYVASSHEAFEKANIPRDSHWVWNQSNSKITVKAEDHSMVTFRKINPRKKVDDRKAPSFKVWLYHIHLSDGRDWYFLWVEKGTENQLDSTGISTAIGYVFPQHLSIGDLAFLSPYVDYEIALALGWA